MKNIVLTTIILLILISKSFSQISKKGQSFGVPIWTDSLSTIFFPAHYNEELLSANKIAFMGSYYANLIVYDFTSDTYKKLFPTDTFIEGFRTVDYHSAMSVSNRCKNISSKWVFLLVKNKDTNESGRIDENDPSVFYATNLKGENLQPLTDETENVVGFEIYEDQGFGLLRIQRDSDNDKSFKFNDRVFYYKKFDLNDLRVGKAIELR